MLLEELKMNIGKLVAKNNEKQACVHLKKEISYDSSKYVEFTLLLSRYNTCYTDRYAGFKNYKKVRRELRVINNDLLHFVETLEQLDLDSNDIVGYKEVKNPILVLTINERVEDLHTFFMQLNFVNVIVKPIGWEINIDRFDLIVFDNQDLGICKDEKDLSVLSEEKQTLIKGRIQRMDNVVKNSNKFIIHFGGMFYWVGKNRKRVHAANSQFSLYARTKELVDFINTYRV